MSAYFIFWLVNVVFLCYTEGGNPLISRNERCYGKAEEHRHLFKRDAPTPTVIKGNFDTPISGGVNQRTSYTYYFDYNYSPYQNWTIKVCLKSPSVTLQYPLVAAIRQSMSIRSLRLPFTFHGTESNYSHVCYPLCPLGNIYPFIKEGIQTVEVELSSVSPIQLPFELVVSRVTEFVLETNQNFFVNITPVEPTFMEYLMPDGVETVLVEVSSDDPMCMSLAVQDVQCPFYYSDKKIEHKGYYQTATTQAGITVSRSKFKRGKLYIIVMLRPTDRECTGSFETGDEVLRRKEVLLNVSLQISDNAMFLVVLYTFLIYLASLLLPWAIYAIIRRCYSASKQAKGTDEDELLLVNSSGTYGEELVSVNYSGGRDVATYRSKGMCSEQSPLLISDECLVKAQKSSNQKERFHLEMKTYPSYLVIICIFYGLPVLQLVLLNLGIVRNTGDQDLCYYNFLCSHEWWIFIDFNHVYSNIGYVILGFVYVYIVWRKKTSDEVEEEKQEHNARTGIQCIAGRFAKKDNMPFEAVDRSNLISEVSNFLSKVQVEKLTGEMSQMDVFFINQKYGDRMAQFCSETFKFISTFPVQPWTVSFVPKNKEKFVPNDGISLINALLNIIGYKVQVRLDPDGKCMHASYIRQQDVQSVETFGRTDTNFNFISKEPSEPWTVSFVPRNKEEFVLNDVTSLSGALLKITGYKVQVRLDPDGKRIHASYIRKQDVENVKSFGKSDGNFCFKSKEPSEQCIAVKFAKEYNIPFEEVDRSNLISEVSNFLNKIQAEKLTGGMRQMDVFFINRKDGDEISQFCSDTFKFISASPVQPWTVSFVPKNKKRFVLNDATSLSSALLNIIGYEAQVRLDPDGKRMHASYIREQDVQSVESFGKSHFSFESEEPSAQCIAVKFAKEDNMPFEEEDRNKLISEISNFQSKIQAEKLTFEMSQMDVFFINRKHNDSIEQFCSETFKMISASPVQPWTVSFVPKNKEEFVPDDVTSLSDALLNIIGYKVQMRLDTDGKHIHASYIRKQDLQTVVTFGRSDGNFSYNSKEPSEKWTVSFVPEDKEEFVPNDVTSLSDALLNIIGYEVHVRLDPDGKHMHASYIREQDLKSVEAFGKSSFNFKSKEPSEPPGIPPHSGIFYAIGVALIMEGFCSAFYHVCPNKSNFQFDTTFMYVMSVLGISKLYYGRHPRSIPRSSVLLWSLMAVAVMLVILSFIAEHDRVFWIIYIIFHACVITFVAHRLYFLSKWKISWYGIKETFCHCPGKSKRYFSSFREHPWRAFLTWLVIIGNILWDICIPSNFSFVLFQLTLFIGNLFIYVAFYLGIKKHYKEKINYWKVGPLLVLCAAFWLPATNYFFTAKTEWQNHPALSRQVNSHCMIASFYDEHDLWHFLSSYALFFSFLLMLYLDDGIKDIPFEQIRKI